MQIVFAFIYYFAFAIVLATLSLLVFVLPSARRLLYDLRIRFDSFFQNEFVRYAKYLTFVVIFIILFQSFYTYSSLNSHFKRKLKYDPENIGMEDFDIMSSGNRQSYLIQLKQYREFYMSQRNIMLTFTTLFVFFAFNRLLHNILKFAKTEYEITLIKNQSESAKGNS